MIPPLASHTRKGPERRAYKPQFRQKRKRSRRRRGLARLRDLFRFCRNRDLYIRRSWFSACARHGWYNYPRTVSHVSETLRGRVSERRTLPLLGLGHGCSQRTQRAFGTAMRLCASLFRRRRGPAGLRRPTPPAERTVLAPISPRVQLCLRRPAFPLSAFIPGAWPLRGIRRPDR